MAVIVIRRRRGGWRDLLRAYSVFIDGQMVGRIRLGQSQEYKVPPGHHIVHLKIDWGRSPEIEVAAEVGDRVRLICAPGGSPIAILDPILRIGTYISLDHE